MTPQQKEPVSPAITQAYADDGEHSHWRLIDTNTGELLWTEDPEEDKRLWTGKVPQRAPQWIKIEDGCRMPPLRAKGSYGSIDVIGIQPSGEPVKCYYHYQLNGWYSPESVEIVYYIAPPTE